MSDSNGDSGSGGYPDDVFKQMTKDHERFMRDLEQQGRRLQQDADKHFDTSTKPRDNFFLNFKDFVDTNLGSLAENLRNFPKNVSELKAKMQEAQVQRKREERQLWERWTGLGDTPDHARMVADRSPETRQEAISAALMLLREARDRNAHVAPEKIEALYHDPTPFGSLDRFASPMLSEGGACYYFSETVNNLPSTARWGAVGRTPRWLSIDWFKRSPYSPVNLECYPASSPDIAPQFNWRAAFEDLLNAALDKPMTSREQLGRRINAKPQSTHYGPGLDWMLSLQCRGILPPHLPSLYNTTPGWVGQRNAHSAADINVLDGLLKGGQQIRSAFDTNFRVRGDFDALVDEIATPAPDYGFGDSEPEEVEQHSLDYYQAQLVAVEKANERRLLEALLGQDNVYQNATGLKQPVRDHMQDQMEIEDAFFEALFDGNVTKAVECINTWHDEDRDVADLVREPIREFLRDICDESWLSVFNEALRKSDLPETDAWKQSARERYDQGVAERHEQEREALGLNDERRKLATRDTSTQTMPSEPATPSVDVLSSLTTTQTTRMPDGTITTKVVLKQKFADGREESHEKVHTYHEPREQTEDQVKKVEPETPKKGWFWT